MRCRIVNNKEVTSLLYKTRGNALISYFLNILQNKTLKDRHMHNLLSWVQDHEQGFVSTIRKKNDEMIIDDMKSSTPQKCLDIAVQAFLICQEENLGVAEDSFGSIMRLCTLLFRLEPEEAQNLVCCNTNEDLEKLVYCQDDRWGGIKGRMHQLEVASIATGVSKRAITSILKPRGKLAGCGLVASDYSEVWWKASDNILTLFHEGAESITLPGLIERLIGYPVKSELKWQDFDYIGPVAEMLEKILRVAMEKKEPGINILFYGKPGTGKTEFCRVLAEKIGITLYANADMDEDGGEVDRSQRLQSLRMLQTILGHSGNGAVMVDEAEDIFGYETEIGINRKSFSAASNVKSKVYLNRQLENNPVPIIWVTNNANNMDKSFIRRMTYCLEFTDLPFNVRLGMAQQECKKQGLIIEDHFLKKFSDEYNATPAMIANAARAARLTGGGIETFREVVCSQDKLITCEKRSESVIEEYSLELINTDVDLEKLLQIILRKGKFDVSFCLYGPPGSGKSEFSRWFAEKLGLELMTRRASDLISKYVGESERNIATVFREAASQRRFLVFDEADSFIGSRREALRSWEVTQVNEMLTWMERHPLPFVCSTNLIDRIDEAAFRRFTFKVKFDFMRQNQISIAFRKFFGEEAPPEAIAMEFLTPGDFAVVKKKAEYFGVATVAELCDLLKQETQIKLKNRGLQKIGFLGK